MFGNNASQRRAGAGTQGDHYRVASQCQATLISRKGVGKNRDAGREQECAAEALESASGDQKRQRICRATDGRANAKERQPAKPYWLAPDYVGPAPEGQQCGSDGGKVGNDDPFDGSADGRMECPGDGWSTDINNRR